MPYLGLDIARLSVSPEEIRQYLGIDLKYRLDTDVRTGNPSDDEQAFINRVRIRMNTYIDSYFGMTGGVIDPIYPEPTDFQRYHYKIALIEQVNYILLNGDITARSGLDDNGNMVTTRQDIEQLSIGPEAKSHLILAGLFNRRIRRWGFCLRWWYD